MDFIEIEILNWDKYNPRSDRTVTVWFRFQNDFFMDQKLWGLNDSERVTFLFLLCEASKVQCSKVKLNLDYICTQRRRNQKLILEDIEVLTRLGVLNPPIAELHPPVGGRTPDKVLATIQTNNTNNTNKYNAQSGDFADFWVGYPRKVGKGKTAKAYLREIKSGAKHEELCSARDRYRKHCEENHTESKFIKHGSTFMSEWRDWLDPETGQSEDFSQKEKSIEEMDFSHIFGGESA